MDEFWKGIAVVLIAVVLGLVIERDFLVLLTLTACSIVAAIAFQYLKPVLQLLWDLNELGKLHDGVLTFLLKAVGIAMVSELAALICMDAGNRSMAKILELLGCTAITFLSIPILKTVLTLIQDILFTI